jgi:ubiquinone/menaquinone biosynthesis C-methylase UbiE
MSFVIEHLTDPGQVLREVHRIIKKDGRVVVLTDNAGF